MRRFVFLLVTALSCLLISSTAIAAIVAVCHFPPGNPSAAHTVLVGPKAADAHLRNHTGDFLGFCGCQGDGDCPQDDDPCTMSQCREGECVDFRRDCGDGVCDPSTGECAECIVDSDCRLFNSFCDGCDCLALPANAPDPICEGSPVICLVAPCEAGPFFALCTDGACEAREVFCTEDVKTCPDGSFVSRVAPSCEFAPCPE